MCCSSLVCSCWHQRQGKPFFCARCGIHLSERRRALFATPRERAWHHRARTKRAEALSLQRVLRKSRWCQRILDMHHSADNSSGKHGRERLQPAGGQRSDGGAARGRHSDFPKQGSRQRDGCVDGPHALVQAMSTRAEARATIRTSTGWGLFRRQQPSGSEVVQAQEAQGLRHALEGVRAAACGRAP